MITIEGLVRHFELARNSVTDVIFTQGVDDEEEQKLEEERQEEERKEEGQDEQLEAEATLQKIINGCVIGSVGAASNGAIDFETFESIMQKGLKPLQH